MQWRPNMRSEKKAAASYILKSNAKVFYNFQLMDKTSKAIAVHFG